MDNICDKDICTGCGVCAEICPHQCITMREDPMGCLHPYIDREKCVDCHLCIRTCPNNHELPLSHPTACYAAWSKDDATRRTSASGGIAAEFYKYTLAQGGASVGVTMDYNEGCRFIAVTSAEDIAKVKNSKYVHPDTDGIYAYAKSRILTGDLFLFIGLPCHIAALKSYLGKDYPNLITVDLICHGKVPYTYLRQHLDHITKGRTADISAITFRDPQKRTANCYFSVYRRGDSKPIYSKPTDTNDPYQLGFHKCLSYCEACYSCRYAQRQRISDITIGDFSGLSKNAPYSGPCENVSAVIINTNRGADFFDRIVDVDKDPRPLSEALDYEHQLNAPSVRHKNRRIFEKEYLRTKDYRHSAHKSLKGEIVKGTCRRLAKNAKERITRLTPLGLKTLVYKILKH